jgi:hypothetical protein
VSETPLSSGWVLREPDNRQVVELGRQIREWLDPAEWASWDLKTRIRFVAAAHGWVRSAYGLDGRQLLFEELPREVHGRFDTQTGEVSVNRDLLLEDDPLPLLETLAHENRHAVQASWLDWGATERPAGTPVADTELALWQHGMATYDIREFDNYWYNAIEVDAREAGHNLTAGYQRRDGELLREQLRHAGPAPAPTPTPTPARPVRGIRALRRRFSERRGREAER